MKKKVSQFIIMIFLVMLICPVMDVKADDNEYYCTKRNFKEVVYNTKYTRKEGVWLHLNMPPNAKKYKVSVNKKKLAKVKVDSGSLLLYPKKNGTLKVTVTAVSKGKKVKSKGTIKIVKFQNPFKTLNIGGKNCLKKINMRCNQTGFNTQKTSLKIQYKLKKGWKFTYKSFGVGDADGNYKEYNLKSGKTYNLPVGGDAQFYVFLKNKKTGAVVIVNLEVFQTGTPKTKIQYRYSDKVTTTSTSPKLNGWTLYDTKTGWGNWGKWSGWSTAFQTASDSKQVETRKEYRYYYFYCPVCGGREPYQGKSDCGKYTLSKTDWNEKWFTTAYKNSKSKTYSYSTAKRYTTSLGDGKIWNFSSGNLNSTAAGTKDSDSNDIVIRNAYRYRTRSKVTTYYFYKWGAWSNWSNTKYTATANRKVETRKVTVQ